MDGMSGFSGAIGKQNIFVKFWNLLDGKKTIIATLYWSVISPMLPIIFSDGIPANLNKIYLAIGIILSAIGLGDKFRKSMM